MYYTFYIIFWLDTLIDPFAERKFVKILLLLKLSHGQSINVYRILHLLNLFLSLLSLDIICI